VVFTERLSQLPLFSMCSFEPISNVVLSEDHYTVDFFVRFA